MADFLILLWVGCGWWCHIATCINLEKGRAELGMPSIWDDVFTYVMFFPSAIAGPLLFPFAPFTKGDDEKHP